MDYSDDREEFHVRIEPDEGVAIVALDWLERRNAMDPGRLRSGVEVTDGA